MTWTINCTMIFNHLLELQRRAECVAEESTDHGTAKLIPQVGDHVRGHGDGDEEEAPGELEYHSTTTENPIRLELCPNLKSEQ